MISPWLGQRSQLQGSRLRLLGWGIGPRRRWGALSDAAIRPSVCLSVRMSLPPRSAVLELCGLRIRPRTDVDPPRSAGAYRLAAR